MELREASSQYLAELARRGASSRIRCATTRPISNNSSAILSRRVRRRRPLSKWMSCYCESGWPIFLITD